MAAAPIISQRAVIGPKVLDQLTDVLFARERAARTADMRGAEPARQFRQAPEAGAEIESEVAALIGKVNGRFGDAAWTPIRYVNRSYSRTVLAGIYRAADVAMTTPLRDGMNLGAKEFLAAQDPDDPGVLMLSQFAGAAVELDEALIVNPHETDAVAAALKRALEMPREERRERHAPMLAHLLKNDIKRWSRSYTSTLVARRNGRSLLGAMRHLLKPLPSRTPRAAFRSLEVR